MGDSYVECLVARDRNIGALILRGFVWVLCALCIIAAMFGGMVFFFIGLALAAVAYFLCPAADIEFEYLYMDKEISIDKIMAKQKRKHVASFDLNKMEKMCPISSHELDMFKGRNVKIQDFSSKKEHSKPYAIVLRDNNEESLVYIEPNEELLKALKSAFPRKIIDF